MDTETSTRALLIDLDNCPGQLNYLTQALANFHRVVVVYGGFDPKIPLSQITVLAQAVVTGQLAIEPMERKGKNAADFGLTFWAGRLLAEMPAHTEFLILSQDTDLDYMIDMLRRGGRRAERIDGNSYPNTNGESIGQDLSTETSPSWPTAPLTAMAETYWSLYIANRRTRPARRFTLINSIRSHFKGTPGVDSDGILQELIRRGVLAVGRGGRIFYRDRATHSFTSLNSPEPANPSESAGPLEPEISQELESIEPLEPIELPLLPEVVEWQILEQETPITPVSVSDSPPKPEGDEDQAATINPAAISTAADEYCSVHITGRRTRPARRVTLLNSIRAHFKHSSGLDPEYIMAELFQRGVVSQGRMGQLNYPGELAISATESPPKGPNHRVGMSLTERIAQEVANASPPPEVVIPIQAEDAKINEPISPPIPSSEPTPDNSPSKPRRSRRKSVTKSIQPAEDISTADTTTAAEIALSPTPLPSEMELPVAELPATEFLLIEDRPAPEELPAPQVELPKKSQQRPTRKRKMVGLESIP